MVRKATFKVADMHCTNCSMHLQAMEDDVPGIQQVDASYQKQLMVVQFDDALITEPGIVDAAKNIGYTAELI
jgi:copper chaperone CopZ